VLPDDLDPVVVSRLLAKHYGDVPATARELKVPSPELRRLIWARPHLLDAAHEAMEVFVALAWGEVIRAVYSDDPRRQMWGAEKLLSSRFAQGHPLARAGPSPAIRAPSQQIVTRWADSPAEALKKAPASAREDAAGEALAE
jgi:hypothetical protein